MSSISRTTKVERQMDGRLIMYVTVCQGAAVLQLLASIDETLLSGTSTILLIDPHLDIADSIQAVNLKSEGNSG